MKNIFRIGAVFAGLLVMMTTGLYSQVEIHLFGLYNMNMAYPEDGSVSSNVQSSFSTFYDEWQEFLGNVLEQDNALGFGGRIAFNISPNFAVEGSVEYVMAETGFRESVTDPLIDLLEGLGYGDNLTLGSGGHILRYYGNVIFNIPAPGNITPYLTVGAGISQFTLREGEGPTLNYLVKWGSLTGAEVNFFYEDFSVLTFNGGLGIKVKLNPNFGFRVDGRIFYSSPEINQFVDYTFFTIEVYDGEPSVTTTGAHIDLALNVGVFLAL